MYKQKENLHVAVLFMQITKCVAVLFILITKCVVFLSTTLM